MEIVHLINDLHEVGGAQRIVRDLVAEHGHGASCVLSLAPVCLAVRAELEEVGCDVLELWPPKLESLRRARQILRSCDVLHVHLFPSLYLGALLSTRKVFTEHNTRNGRRQRSWLRGIERCVYGRYGVVASISEATREALSRWVGSDCVRSVVIRNGISLDRFSRQRRSAPQAPYRIAMVGAFSSQKDQATLVRALHALSDEYELVFVGDGPNLGEVRALADSLGVGGRVRFCGAVPSAEVPAILHDVDLYVQSSNWEGFGLAPVEAMAEGLPVLGSRVDGLSQVIGSDALLFDVGDARDLAAMAADLLSSPDRYEACSTEALKRATCFNRARMASEYMDLYRALASGGGI